MNPEREAPDRPADSAGGVVPDRGRDASDSPAGHPDTAAPADRLPAADTDAAGSDGLAAGTTADGRSVVRCAWPGADPLYTAYHDTEWGVPVRDDRTQFEFLVLESAQAGLSWITILRKRENYRRAYHGFDPEAVARFTDADIARLSADAGIVRNRRKIEASVVNARKFLEIREEFGSFSRYLWSFVDGRPVVNRWTRLSQIPAKTALSDRISADLIRRGFRFVGSTIVYSHLQATGLVNDHLTGCFRRAECLEPPPG